MLEECVLLRPLPARNDGLPLSVGISGACARAEGIERRLDATEIQVRRFRRASRASRDSSASGERNGQPG
ncbi:hypothetical protein [Streptomyces sp. B3I7]|uniref:hypothetical protein n=1 Tax=Streptomyces sp. B3I7 TaxID=3042269 RepID=UPI0027D7DEA7|nr:hypothetical protein [Streptomyces sp. B3I7]